MQELQEEYRNKNDIDSYTYRLSAFREGDIVKFAFAFDYWTHNGDPVNGRHYCWLYLEDAPDKGWFEMPYSEWQKLFF